MSPSSRGLGHHPFTVGTGVRIPLGTPDKTAKFKNLAVFLFPKEKRAYSRGGSEGIRLQANLERLPIKPLS